MKKIIALIIVIGAIAFSYSTYYGVQVTATIERDGEINRCKLSSPLFVSVKNNTFSTVREVTFNLELFKDNRSQNVLIDISNGYRIFDIIVPPFSEQSGCYTDSYIKSFLNSNRVEMREANSKEAALSVIESVKNFREFEDTHKLFISNITVSYME